MTLNPHKIIRLAFWLLITPLTVFASINDNSSCDINKLLQDAQSQNASKDTINLIDYQKLNVIKDDHFIKNHLPEFSVFLNEIDNNKIMDIISKNSNP